MHVLTQTAAQPVRSNPANRTFAVTIGNLELTAEAEVTGAFRPATQDSPSESPDVEIVRLWGPNWCDLSGLLEDKGIFEQVDEAIYRALDHDHPARVRRSSEVLS